MRIGLRILLQLALGYGLGLGLNRSQTMLWGCGSYIWGICVRLITQATVNAY